MTFNDTDPWRPFALFSVGGKLRMAHVACAQHPEWAEFLLGQVNLYVRHERHHQCVICNRHLNERSRPQSWATRTTTDA